MPKKGKATHHHIQGFKPIPPNTDMHQNMRLDTTILIVREGFECVFYL